MADEYTEVAVRAMMDQVIAAVAAAEWPRVLTLAGAVLALDPGHHQAAVFHRTATRLGRLAGTSSAPGAVAAAAPAPQTAPGCTHSHELEQVVTSSVELSPFSPVATRLLRMLDDEAASSDQIARLIATDAVLTAGIMSMANSAFYRRGGPIRTLRDGLVALGSREIRSLVVATCLMGSMPHTNVIDHRSFWRFSLAVAVLSDLIARSQRLANGEAFTAGVMHSVGLLAMDAYCPTGLRTVADMTGAGLRRIHDREVEVFGFTDADLGARLSAQWHLPDQVVRAISCGGRRLDEFTPEEVLESAVVRARIFARAQGLSDGIEQSEPREITDEWLQAPVNRTLETIGGWDAFLGRIDAFFATTESNAQR